MENNTYALQIRTDKVSSEEISKILEKKSNISEDGYWIYKVVRTPQEPYFDFINEFLNILENKHQILNQNGVDNSDITIWVDYKYDGQFNLEFLSTQLKRLGEHGISLLIKCRETDASRLKYR